MFLAETTAATSTYAVSDISTMFSSVLGLFTSAIDFLLGNPLMLVLCVAPVALGILAAILSVLNGRKGG